MPSPIARNTRQKSAIKRAFEDAGRPLSAQQVLDAARGMVAGTGMATVYRNIRALLDEGWLVPVELPGGATFYELSGKAHHHHFHCERCLQVFDLDHCAAAALGRMAPKDFSVTRHEVVLYGACSACQRKSRSAGAS